ncbi:MAG: hypothetical protein SGJ17_06280 [Hyphomicrobiales bacterium]|nr:hypothetical protein [Hyphomicrobiales bacterium]
MNPLPITPELLRAAKRIIWFKQPETALRNPIELLAFAMGHATDEDMALLIEHVGLRGLAEAIDHAPAGVIDARSWSYWNAKLGRTPSPPLPSRDFDRSKRPRRWF